MTRLKKIVVLLIVGMGIAFFLTGCGSGHETKGLSAETSNTSLNPQDIQPDIHTNLPPPQSNYAIDTNTAENFFKNKVVYDGFSDGLKNNISRTYQTVGTTPHFNTLLGVARPKVYGTKFSGTGSSTPSSTPAPTPTSSGSSTTPATTPAPSSGNTPTSSPSPGCDPKSSVICLDSPQDGFETVEPGVDVVGNIDLSQLAVFSSTDPVLVVSVFNESSASAASEMAIMPGDVQATNDPNVGHFTAAIGLGGAGKFTIVVSAYKVSGSGNELVSIMIHGTRLEAPEIEFVEAKPDPANFLAEADKRQDPVNDGAVIAAEALDVKVKLKTIGGDGVKTKFEDFDADDHLQSSIVALPQQGSADIVGKVFLHQGLNKITITSYSPAINAQQGQNAPAPSVLHFSVFNAWGGPKIKLIKPEKDGLIPQDVAGEKVALEFCLTFLPNKVQGSAGGQGSTPPTISDDCVTGGMDSTSVSLTVNAKEVTATYNASTGIFSAEIDPDFGINIYEINADNVVVPEAPKDSKTSSSLSGSFVYGVPMPLFRDGKINQASNITDYKFDNFTNRGLNIDIDRSMVEGDIKTMLIKFLNRPDTTKLLLDNFKSVANKPGYVCGEYIDPNTGKPAASNGDTTINFLQDSFKLGSIELTNLKSGSDGLLHVGVVINGMHGDADLRAAESNGNTFNGLDLGFLPVTFSISKLELNIGVAFPKKSDIDLNKDGEYEQRSVLDIHEISGLDVIKITGDGPLGRPVYVNSNRNPLAAGIELLDWQQGLLLSQFNTIMGGTILCGVENGLNNELSGALGKGIADLEKLTAYDKNLFRLPLGFDLFGKHIDLDVAYDILKGDIKFDYEGIHIRNVPLRFNPGQTMLLKMVKDFTNGVVGAVSLEGVVGAVSRWKPVDEAQPTKNITIGDKNLGIELSEDGINQALFAANMAGLLDLDIDANFYMQNNLIPTKAIAPMGGGGSYLAQQIDANQDGSVDEDDASIPILLRVRTDKTLPPMLTFLSKEETERLADLVNSNTGGSASATPAPNTTPSATPNAASADKVIDPEGRYFRLAVANLDLSAYRQAPVAASEGGVRSLCEINIPQTYNSYLESQGLCPVAGDARPLIDPSKLAKGITCPKLIDLPNRNGDIVSAQDTTSANYSEPTPLYRLKASLLVHGEFKGIKKVIPAKDHLTIDNPVEKEVLQLRFVPKPPVAGFTPLYNVSIQVLENHTNVPNSQLIDNFEAVLSDAIGKHCSNLNELLIPVPNKFPKDPAPGDPEPKDLLPDFDVKAIDLGGESGNIPNVFIDDNHLYLDIMAFAGLVFTDDVATPSPTPGGGN